MKNGTDLNEDSFVYTTWLIKSIHDQYVSAKLSCELYLVIVNIFCFYGE